MWLGRIIERRLFLLQFLIVSFPCAHNIRVSETADDKIDQESTPEGTTTASMKPIAADSRQLKSPIVMENVENRNDSKIFRPSIHLGEIEQSASRANPFNSVQHVNFENNVRLDRQRDFQDIHQDSYQDVSSLLDEATRPSRIKFRDDSVVPATIDTHHTFEDHEQVVTESSNKTPYVEEGVVKHMFVDPSFFQSDERQTEEHAIFGKPAVDHRLTSTYFDASRSPYVIGYYTTGDQNTYQTIPQETAYEPIKKPESSVLVLQQQSTYTRKRKFPYQFYQPGSDYHEVKYVEEPRHSTLAYPQMRKLSPWKKIIHLIGTFLPLGLLLATLTPNIVRVDNTTQPNIVLSKLRAVDLPVEHKRASRLLDDQSITCEDRSICELILAGKDPESNMLQNILWNLATRVSDDIAARNGLREVFGAVKKQDCTAISC